MRPVVQSSKWSVVVAVVAVAALLVSGCGSGDDDTSEPETSTPVDSGDDSGDDGSSSVSSGDSAADEAAPEPTVASEPLGAPYVAELPWGDFTLADRIADKLAAGQQLNFVLSVTATGAGGSGEILGNGWAQASGEVDASVNARVIGPNSADRAAQIETIDSLISAGSIDCLAVEADDPDSFVEIINRAVGRRGADNHGRGRQR